MTNSALQSLRAQPHMSYSQVSTFTACSKKWDYRYRLKEPETHAPSALAFGSALHRCLEFYYRNEQKPDLLALEAEFEKAWQEQLAGDKPILFDDAGPDELCAKGVELIEVFLESGPRYHEILAVEQSFKLDIVDFETGEVLPPFVGAIDLIVRDEAGQITVVDHKSCKAKWAQSRLDQDLQLSAYSWAAKQLGYGDVRLGVHLFMKKKKADFLALYTERSDADHRDFIETCIGVHRAVGAGVVYPVRGWMCSGCSYAAKCTLG